ncbi:enoyl-CoA hydratase/isomerase family protein [Bradyrhizobium sp. RDT46]|uniref:enoyl-CoA hydratase/isomerase family protein n=1 Tax=Bradyrhizobium sp. RDT46 TaxID=3341829 RepID=UPI0035C6C9A2
MFCAGADLQNLRRRLRDGPFQAKCRLCRPAALLQNATKPAIVRLGGVCMAGGMGLLVHDRHGDCRRQRHLRSAGGQGRRVP